MKLRLWFLCCQLDYIHLIQLLLAGHGHISGGNPCLISRHEIFQLCDFLLLPVVGRFQLSLLHRINFLEFIIIAHIPVQLLVFHMIDQIYHAV